MNICLLLVSLLLSKSLALQKLSESCIFKFDTYKSEVAPNGKPDVVKGVAYDLGTSKVCCKNAIPDDATMSILQRSKYNCCIYSGDCAFGGMRGCAATPCIATFPSGQANTQDNTYPDKLVSSKICTSQTMANGNMGSVRIEEPRDHQIGLTDGNPCHDRNFPVHIIFVRARTEKSDKSISFIGKSENHQWCCKKDIFDDYTLDPKSICCGLSGAHSPYYYGGKKLDTDTPKCCRGQGGRPACEPYVGPQWKYNQKCPPYSGYYNVTPDLTHQLGFFVPMFYSLETIGKSLWSPGRTTCKYTSNPKKETKYFYTLSTALQRLSEKESTIGLCCNVKDMFYYDEKTMLKSCCIGYFTTETDDRSELDKRYKEIGQQDKERNSNNRLPCSYLRSTPKVVDGELRFHACHHTATGKCRQNELALENHDYANGVEIGRYKSPIKSNSVVDHGLYGTEEYFQPSKF